MGLTKVRKLIGEPSELGNLAIVTIKPGFYDMPVAGVHFHHLAEGLITSVGLNHVCTAEKKLTQSEVKILYSSIFPDLCRPKN